MDDRQCSKLIKLPLCCCIALWSIQRKPNIPAITNTNKKKHFLKNLKIKCFGVRVMQFECCKDLKALNCLLKSESWGINGTSVGVAWRRRIRRRVAWEWRWRRMRRRGSGGGGEGGGEVAVAVEEGVWGEEARGGVGFENGDH